MKLLEKILTPHRLASFQIPGLRLQMGYPHYLFSYWLALLCSNISIVPFPPSSSPLSIPASAADRLVGKIEANRWNLPPFATIKCTHLPTSTSVTCFSLFSYTGTSVSTLSKGKSLTPWSGSYSFLPISENRIYCLFLSLLPQQIFILPWIIAITYRSSLLSLICTQRVFKLSHIGIII